MTLPLVARQFMAGDSYPPSMFGPPIDPSIVLTSASPSHVYFMSEGGGGQSVRIVLNGTGFTTASKIVLIGPGGAILNYLTPSAQTPTQVSVTNFAPLENANNHNPPWTGFAVSNDADPMTGPHSNVMPVTTILVAPEPPHATLDSLTPATAPISGGPVVVTLTGTNYSATRPVYCLVSPTGEIWRADGIQTDVTYVNATTCTVTLNPPAAAGNTYVRIPQPGVVGSPPDTDYLPFAWT